MKTNELVLPITLTLATLMPIDSARAVLSPSFTKSLNASPVIDSPISRRSRRLDAAETIVTL